MKLEAVTICVGYSCLLEAMLLKNTKHFDNHIVVTSLEDARTETLCEKFGAKVVKTERITKEGFFQKGKGVNEGFAALGREDWILHVDADIILPSDFRDMLEAYDLNKAYLYGCTRMCQIGKRKFYHPSDQEWIHDQANIIGFFQLFNSFVLQHRELPWYPENSYTCGQDDLAFSDLWANKNREMLPDCFEALHLGNPYDARRWEGLLPPDRLLDRPKRQSIQLSPNLKEVFNEKEKKQYKLF